MTKSPLTSLPIMIEPDPARTVIRPFAFSYPEGLEDGRPPRAQVVAERVMALPQDEAERFAKLLVESMTTRHRNAEATFRRRYDELGDEVHGLAPDATRQVLIGAVFSQEYAFESAALFNPSIIADPRSKQDGDCTDFLLSLRGVGEGHISSVTFRTGRWRGDGEVEVDPASPQAIAPRIARRIDGDGVELDWADCRDDSETVIFPVRDSQRQGVEDVRLVTFVEDDGTREVVGTYTAFDGRDARAELLHGTDFHTMEMRPLTGAMARYKGMALFPRRIGGRYAMLGRQDNERIWLLTSDEMCHWEEGKPIMAPRYPWEWVQMGNCGSPLEIDEGWLVLTHGVGMVRSYCIGACLLDGDDPSKVLARTPDPLIMPSLEQRGGYVPNVVYGCGMLARGRELLIPYAIGDRVSTFATGTVDDILAAMERMD